MLKQGYSPSEVAKKLDIDLIVVKYVNQKYRIYSKPKLVI